MSSPWTEDRRIDSRRYKAPNLCRSAVAVASYLIFASLTLLVLSLLAFTGNGSRFNEQVRAKVCGTTVRDESPAAPTPPSSTMIFHPIDQLENLSYSNDEAWAQATLTRLGGLIRVKYNETYSTPWGISMFHALHCLQMLRSGVQVGPYAETLDVGNVSEQRTKDHHDGGLMDPTHLGHCIGYIAQYLLCAADSTLEPPRIRHDGDGNVIKLRVDGMGYQHQCRDSTFLWEAVERSERSPVQPWPWELGDTVESVFGSSSGRRSPAI